VEEDEVEDEEEGEALVEEEEVEEDDEVDDEEEAEEVVEEEECKSFDNP
jgi:hypothetical protein